MIENNKPIPEADDPLQHSLMMPNNKIAKKQQNPGVKDVAREVDKFISRLPSNYNQLQSADVKEGDNDVPIPEEKMQREVERHFIGKYNYTGRKYRFQQAEKELQIDKPEVVSKTKTEADNQQKNINVEGFSIPGDKDSILAQDSFDRSEVKYPSHNYYIMFDKKQNKKKRNIKEGKYDQLSKTVCLENKVKKLENEVKMLRQFSTASATATGTGMGFRKEGKMKLEQLLDSIIS